MKGHGMAADWYTLGIFIYELMHGRPPFMHSDTYEVFKMIIHGKIVFPPGFSSDAKSLVRHLTDHNLAKRFGNMLKGSKDIEDHRFFKDINWQDLLAKRTIPPYVPLKKAAPNL